MDVADVRRSLCTVRRLWGDNSPERPFNLAAPLPCGLSVSQFCFGFVLIHHSKRLNRTVGAESPAGGGELPA